MDNVIIRKQERQKCSFCRIYHLSSKKKAINNYCHLYLIKKVIKDYELVISFEKDFELYIPDKVSESKCANCHDMFFSELEPFLFPSFKEFQSVYSKFFQYIYHLECLKCKNENGFSLYCDCITCKCEICDSRDCVHLGMKTINVCICQKCGKRFNNLMKYPYRISQCVKCIYLNGKNFPCVQINLWGGMNECEELEKRKLLNFQKKIIKKQRHQEKKEKEKKDREEKQQQQIRIVKFNSDKNPNEILFEKTILIKRSPSGIKI